jgi:hypothetical protein
MTIYAMTGIIVAGIVDSIAFGTYMYTEYQPNFISLSRSPSSSWSSSIHS